MRGRRAPRAGAFLLAIAGVMAAARPASAALILTLDPTPITLLSGDIGTLITLDVNIGVEPGTADDADNLYAYQFSVMYDTTLLGSPVVSEGSFFTNVYPPPGTTSFFEGIEVTPGLIAFVANTLVGPVAGVSGSGTLATLQFEVLAASGGAVSPVSAFLDPENGDGFIQGEQTAVVPEPGTLLLVATGAALLARRRRRLPRS
jgi:hypothetical protein